MLNFDLIKKRSSLDILTSCHLYHVCRPRMAPVELIKDDYKLNMLIFLSEFKETRISIDRQLKVWLYELARQ